MPETTVSVHFTEQQLELIDRLAAERSVSREEAIAQVIEAEYGRGLTALGTRDALPTSIERPRT